LLVQEEFISISDNYRRQGVGSDIVKKLEEYAMKHGAKKMILNAREDAIRFYASLGYIKGSPYKSDTGIPHTTMEKYLV
jgi:predicted GNAT family N-acyltransferase